MAYHYLDPLGDYLKTRQFEVDYLQGWTPKLEAAVKQYLLHEAPRQYASVVLNELFIADPEASQEARIEAVVKFCDPVEVFITLHDLAVRALPSLEAVIGDVAEPTALDRQSDIAAWLFAHATLEQLVVMAQHAGQTDHAGEYRDDEARLAELALDLSENLSETVKSIDLLRLWGYVSRPDAVPSDLTPEEWALVELYLPKTLLREKGFGRAEQTQQAINGFLYRFTTAVPWRKMPVRYGIPASLQVRYSTWRKAGVFLRLLESLQGTPGTARLVSWLETTRQ